MKTCQKINKGTTKNSKKKKKKIGNTFYLNQDIFGKKYLFC